MNKIIRITETELINIVKRVIDEGKLDKSTKEKDLDVKMDGFRDKIKNYLKTKDCAVKQVGTDFEIHCNKKHVGQVMFRRDYIIVKKKGNKFGKEFGFNEMGRIKAELNKVIRLTESDLSRSVESVLNERRLSASELIKDMTIRDIADIVNKFTNKTVSIKEVKEEIEYKFRNR